MVQRGIAKIAGLAGAVLLVAVAVGCEEESSSAPPQLQTILVEDSSLVVGETVRFLGPDFLTPEEGVTQLVFEGDFLIDQNGQTISEKVGPLTITPIFDGEFIEDGSLNDELIPAGTRILRWNRFGPHKVPFTDGGNRAGTFKGTVTHKNVYNDGTIENGEPSPLSITVEPSIVIRRLEPMVGLDENGGMRTAECGEPALRGHTGMPYLIEVEAVGFDPAFFNYEIAGVNGKGASEIVSFSHQATGAVDRLGDPDWPQWSEGEYVIFNAMPEDVEYNIASIRVVGIPTDTSSGKPFYETALPFQIVRPVHFVHEGGRELAEYYPPEVVNGPIPGGIGTTIQYSESKSEARQQAVSVSVSQSWSQSQSNLTTESWSEGFAQTNSVSKSNSVGQSHSEAETSGEAYGVNYSTTESNKVDYSSSDGSTWGWNKSQDKSSEEYQQEVDSIYGEVSAEVSTEVNGKTSIPGVAEVGGKVGTSVGASVGGQTGTTVGEKVGTKESHGSSMGGSSSTSESFGSATTDAKGESLSGTYAVSSQSAINNTTSESEASSESTTYNIGGSTGSSESVSVGNQETWSQTWVTTEAATEQLSVSGKIPNGRCAVIYRQTVRHVKRAQLYSYDLCGVRSHMGELYFNEWSWSPNIVIGDDCEQSLPEPTLPRAECFLACD